MVMAGLDRASSRISESVSFMDWGFKAWRVKQIFAKGAEIEKARVENGSATKVAVVAPQLINVTYPASLSKPVYQTKVRYFGEIKAPVAAGQHIADLVITTPDAAPAIIPLVAAEDISEAGFFRRILNAILSLFGL